MSGEINPNSEPATAANTALVLFRIEGQRYALRLGAVDRVIRAVAVTPVPEMPAFVLGVINLAGQILPVFSLRRCLGLPDRALRPADQFVIARTSRLAVAVVVDEVLGVDGIKVTQTVAVEDALPPGEYRVQGMVKLDGDIILIYDLEQLLSREDQGRILRVQEMAEKVN
jgi:purine-binding chemotaxis protein CheW